MYCKEVNDCASEKADKSWQSLGLSSQPAPSSGTPATSIWKDSINTLCSTQDQSKGFAQEANSRTSQEEYEKRTHLLLEG